MAGNAREPGVSVASRLHRELAECRRRGFGRGLPAGWAAH